MRGLPGWGLFVLLAAIIALSYPLREHTQKEFVLDQVTMEAPAMMPAFARTIHIQKDGRPNAQADVPLWTYMRQAPSLRKGDIACATCLPVSLPVQANHSANPCYTAREPYKADTGLDAPRNRVLLFWKVKAYGRTVALS